MCVTIIFARDVPKIKINWHIDSLALNLATAKIQKTSSWNFLKDTINAMNFNYIQNIQNINP